MSTALEDPRELRDPLLLPEEQKYHEEIENVDSEGNLLVGAAALGAAFFGYRWYMQRRLKEEMARRPKDSKSLAQAVVDVYADYQNIWIRTVMPHLISGYADGLIAVHTGNIPERVVYEIALGYASRLGEHINEVSSEAVVSGFQAQLNRKVPPAKALQRVLEAFGVPPRAMNALVNVWSAEEPKITTDAIPIDHKRARGHVVIQQALNTRAEMIGENEMWSSRSQAKQVVWMYGIQTGQIPSDSKREWVTADDERVCPSCGPMHGKKVKVNDRFKVPGYGKTWSPPLHPNCRCDMKLVAPPIKERTRGKQLVTKSRADDPAYVKRDAEGQFAKVEQARKAPAQTTRQAPKRIDWQRADDNELAQGLDAADRLMQQGNLSYDQLRYIQDQVETIEMVLASREAVRPQRRQRASFGETRRSSGRSRAVFGDTDRKQERKQAIFGDADTKRSRAVFGDADAQRSKAVFGDTSRAVFGDAERSRAVFGDTKQDVELKEDKKARPKLSNPDLQRMSSTVFTLVEPGKTARRGGQVRADSVIADDWYPENGKGWRLEGREVDLTSTMDYQARKYWDNFERDDVSGLMAHWDAFVSLDEARVHRYREHQTLYLASTYLGDDEPEIEVDFGTFLDVWHWTLAGKPKSQDYRVEVRPLNSKGEMYNDDIPYSALAEELGFSDLIEENRPVILSTDYVDSGTQDYSFNPKKGASSIAGRWKFQYEVVKGMPGVSVPHEVWYVIPENMDESEMDR